MIERIQRIWSDESGQGLSEYALAIALVSVGLVGVLIVFRGEIAELFTNSDAQMDSAGGTAQADATSVIN